MSGGFVPYHLRPGKAVDRRLFVELLTRASSWKSLEGHVYIGFGGPFLSDFRLLHSHFGIRRMISLEKDLQVHERQRFNLPHSCIEVQNRASGDFVDDYDLDANAIVWLDFTAPGQLRAQLQEVQALVPKLRSGDILRLTLNASPDCLGDKAGDPDEKELARLSVLKARLGEYIPNGVSASDMSQSGLPIVLGGAAIFAAVEALRGLELDLVQLAAYTYRDYAHQMLTLTGVVLAENDRPNFLKMTGIGEWDLASCDWSSPLAISLPALSIRERELLDSQLPGASASTLASLVNYNIGSNEARSAAAFESYAKFYRFYPRFLQVVR